MMQTTRKLWGGLLGLGFVLLLGLGALPVKAQGKDDKPVFHGSDFLSFKEELRTRGAIRFFEETEEIVRSGKFERAFSRYTFLRAQIGRSLDHCLTPMVDQRLRFLREQMHYPEGFACVEPAQPSRRRRPAKPACPPKNQAAKPAKPSDEEKPPIIIPPAVPADQEQKPEGPDTKEDKPSPGEAQKPSPDDQKPAPPPSTWERLKRRMKFWQKDGEG
jgi:hypothetical protein